MKNKFLNLFGWYGALASLLAYVLITFAVLNANNLWYQLLNGTSATGLGLVSFRKKAYQPAILSAIWLIISIIAIIRIILAT